MKLTNNVMLVLTGIILQSNGEELNLNFQQNDYKVRFDRIVTKSYNKQLFKEFSLVTFKYNRTIAVTNGTMISNVELGEDVVVIVQAYKFLSNEYRHFPLRFSANGCKALAANVLGVKTAFARCGNIHGCPIRKGVKYTACNWYPDPSKLPPFIPNGDYKIELQLSDAFVYRASCCRAVCNYFSSYSVRINY